MFLNTIFYLYYFNNNNNNNNNNNIYPYHCIII